MYPTPVVAFICCNSWTHGLETIADPGSSTMVEPAKRGSHSSDRDGTGNYSPDVTRLDAPTSQPWLLGRTQTNGVQAITTMFIGFSTACSSCR